MKIFSVLAFILCSALVNGHKFRNRRRMVESNTTVDPTTAAPTTAAPANLNDISIDFAGVTPKFKLYPTKDKSGPFVWVEFGEVFEMENGVNDTKLAKHAVTNWVSTKSTSLVEKNDGVLGTATGLKKVEFRATLDGIAANKNKNKVCGGNLPSPADPSKPVTYGIDVYFVTQDVTVDIGGENVTIKEGTIKFDVLVENWPFCKADNNLQFAYGVKTSTGEDASTASEKAIKFKLGNDTITIAMPERGFVDGTGKDVSVAIKEQGSSVDAVMTMPGGATLKYDPVISKATASVFPPEDSIDGASTMTTSLSLIILSVFSMIYLL